MNHPYQTGSIMIELCIALVLFMILMTGTVVGIYHVRDSAEYITFYRQALYQSQRLLEQAMAEAHTHFLNVVSISTSSTPFAQELIVKNVSPCKKEIVAKTHVTYKSRTRSAELVADVTDPNYTLLIGGDCDGTALSMTSSQKFLLQLPNTTSTKIDTLNGKIYAAQNTATSATLTVTDKNNMIHHVLDSNSFINSIDAIYNFLFVGFATSSLQVHVFDTTNNASILLASKFSLPGVSGSFPGALSLTYYNNRLYVGTHRTAGNEFHIFDVSDRTNPIWLGSRELNHNVNQIIVRGPYAYLATSGNTKDLIILRVSDPRSIQQTATYDINGNEDAQSLYVLGNYIYIGRNKSRDRSHPEFSILDISQPDTPLLQGSLFMSESISTIHVSGSLAVLFTKDSQPRIHIIDLATTSLPKIINTQIIGQHIKSIDYEENILYGI
jgi:hypothetical protein